MEDGSQTFPDDETAPTGRQIVTTRRFAASREQLFDAWADPARLARWWGPKGFRNTFDTFELRPGGEWRFVMHGPDGTDYRNRSVFVEVVRGARVVLDHLSGHFFRVVATFEDEGDGSRLTFHMIFRSAEERDRVATYAVEANEQNFDRLEAELARAR